MFFSASSGGLGVPQTGTNTRETRENHYATLAWKIPEPEGAKNEKNHGCRKQDGKAQLAMAGAAGGGVTNSHTINMGGLSVVVNGYEAKNDSDLADTIVHRINEMLNEDDSVWGKKNSCRRSTQISQKILA